MIDGEGQIASEDGIWAEEKTRVGSGEEGRTFGERSYAEGTRYGPQTSELTSWAGGRGVEEGPEDVKTGVEKNGTDAFDAEVRGKLIVGPCGN